MDENVHCNVFVVDKSLRVIIYKFQDSESLLAMIHLLKKAEQGKNLLCYQSDEFPHDLVRPINFDLVEKELSLMPAMPESALVRVRKFLSVVEYASNLWFLRENQEEKDDN